MNFKKETEGRTDTFGLKRKTEIKKTAKSTFLGFCENIGEALLEIGKKNPNTGYKRESAYKTSVKNMWKEFRTQIIGGTMSALVLIAFCAAVNLLDWSLGYEVIVDGENVGMVTDRSLVYDAIDEVRDEVKLYLGEETKYEKEPVFVRRVVAKKNLSGIDQIKTSLLSNVDTMVEGYVIYVDGKSVLGVSSEEAADWVLARYKQKFAGEEISEDMSVDFCEPVAVKKEFLHIALLETPEDAIEVLAGNKKEVSTYTVKDEDTLWDIAKKFDTTVESILALNKGASENIIKGMKLKLEKPVPLLSVCTVQTVSLDEAVPYKVEEIKDSSIYQGRTVVAREGRDGSAKVLARVTKVNGVETKKDVLESETVAEPVSRIIKVGTKERPATTGSGTFIRPTYGTLSSRYGSRWNRQHKGIDIAGSYNSDIKAADGGKVIYSGWMSGYGNCVTIDHENGFTTVYGHCASLKVNVGDRVAKGDVIAKMGSTGRSTGTHLHFEVKKNGVCVNPLQYVGY